MAEPEVEAAWRAEFKRIGETQLREALNSGGGFADEPKRQAAFRWLGDEAQARRLAASFAKLMTRVRFPSPAA
jgi:hypothetical protein